MDIDLRGLDGLVAEPQCDDRAINTVLKQVHRRRVSQDVWADAFSSERGACFRSGKHVLPDDVFDGIAAQSVAANGREDGIVEFAGPLFEPRFQRSDGIAAKRCTALLAALALASDMRASAEHNVGTI